MKKKIILTFMSLILCVAFGASCFFVVNKSVLSTSNQPSVETTEEDSNSGTNETYNPKGFWTDKGNYDENMYRQAENFSYPELRTLEIDSNEKMAAIAAYLNDAGSKAKPLRISLKADLDLTAHYWVPINKFAGSFDGNGNEIKFIINQSEYINSIVGGSGGNCVGFFREIVSDVKMLFGEEYDDDYSSSYVERLKINCLQYSTIAPNKDYGYNYPGIGPVPITDHSSTPYYEINWGSLAGKASDTRFNDISNTNTFYGGFIGLDNDSVHADNGFEEMVTAFNIGGLFGKLSNCSLENITFDADIEITKINTTSRTTRYRWSVCVGIVAGYIELCSLENVYISESLKNIHTSGSIIIQGNFIEADRSNTPRFICGGVIGVVHSPDTWISNPYEKPVSYVTSSAEIKFGKCSYLNQNSYKAIWNVSFVFGGIFGVAEFYGKEYDQTISAFADLRKVNHLIFDGTIDVSGLKADESDDIYWTTFFNNSSFNRFQYIGGIIGVLSPPNWDYAHICNVELSYLINYGDIYTNFHAGGVIGLIRQFEFTWNNYSIKDDDKVLQYCYDFVITGDSSDLYGSDGMIILKKCANYGKITNLSQTLTYECTGGIIGEVHKGKSHSAIACPDQGYYKYNESIIDSIDELGKTGSNGVKFTIKYPVLNAGDQTINLVVVNGTFLQDCYNYGDFVLNKYLNSEDYVVSNTGPFKPFVQYRIVGGIVGFANQSIVLLNRCLNYNHINSEIKGLGSACILQKEQKNFYEGFKNPYYGINYMIGLQTPYELNNFIQQVWCYAVSTWENHYFKDTNDEYYLTGNFSNAGTSEGGSNEWHRYSGNVLYFNEDAVLKYGLDKVLIETEIAETTGKWFGYGTYYGVLLIGASIDLDIKSDTDINGNIKMNPKAEEISLAYYSFPSQSKDPKTGEIENTGVTDEIYKFDLNCLPFALHAKENILMEGSLVREYRGRYYVTQLSSSGKSFYYERILAYLDLPDLIYHTPAVTRETNLANGKSSEEDEKKYNKAYYIVTDDGKIAFKEMVGVAEIRIKVGDDSIKTFGELMNEMPKLSLRKSLISGMMDFTDYREEFLVGHKKDLPLFFDYDYDYYTSHKDEGNLAIKENNYKFSLTEVRNSSGTVVDSSIAKRISITLIPPSIGHVAQITDIEIPYNSSSKFGGSWDDNDAAFYLCFTAPTMPNFTIGFDDDEDNVTYGKNFGDYLLRFETKRKGETDWKQERIREVQSRLNYYTITPNINAVLGSTVRLTPRFGYAISSILGKDDKSIDILKNRDDSSPTYTQGPIEFDVGQWWGESEVQITICYVKYNIYTDQTNKIDGTNIYGQTRELTSYLENKRILSDYLIGKNYTISNEEVNRINLYNGMLVNNANIMDNNLKKNGYRTHVNVAVVQGDVSKGTNIGFTNSITEAGKFYDVSPDIYDQLKETDGYIVNLFAGFLKLEDSLIKTDLSIAAEPVDEEMFKNALKYSNLYLFFTFEQIKPIFITDVNRFDTWQNPEEFKTITDLGDEKIDEMRNVVSMLNYDVNDKTDLNLQFDITNLLDGYALDSFCFLMNDVYSQNYGKECFVFDGKDNNKLTFSYSFEGVDEIDDSYFPVYEDFFAKYMNYYIECADFDGSFLLTIIQIAYNYAVQSYDLTIENNYGDSSEMAPEDEVVLNKALNKIDGEYEFDSKDSYLGSEISVYYFQPFNVSITIPTEAKFNSVYYNDKFFTGFKNFTFDAIAEDVYAETVNEHKLIINLHIVRYSSEDYTSPEFRNGVYLIDEADDLIWMSRQVLNKNDFENSRFIQIANINVPELLPIGDDLTAFKGIYDGGHYVIQINVTGSTDYSMYQGIFGKTNGATIKNLTVLGATDTSLSGYAYIGSVVGYAENTTFVNVNNYNLSVKINGSENVSIGGNLPLQEGFGGVVGYADGNCSFVGCSNRANVVKQGKISVTLGALIGFANGNNVKLDQCFDERSSTEMNLIGNKANTETNGIITNSYERYGTKGTTIYLDETGTVISGKTNNRETSLEDENIWTNRNGKTVLKIFYW